MSTLARYSASGFHLLHEKWNLFLYPITYQNIKTELKNINYNNIIFTIIINKNFIKFFC